MERQDGKVKAGAMGVAELRKQVRSVPVKGVKLPTHKLKPPRPPKKTQQPPAPIDRREEQAEKAERMAHLAHSSSLLKSPYKSRVYKEERRKGGMVSFLLQVLAVASIVGGVAYFSDPNALASIDFEAIKDQLGFD
jgi:hypothetical protein